MKIAIAPLSAIAASPGLRLDAEFYVDPGAKARARAERRKARAARLLTLAAQDEVVAEVAIAAASKLGIKLHLPPGWNGGTPNGPWEGD